MVTKLIKVGLAVTTQKELFVTTEAPMVLNVRLIPRSLCVSQWYAKSTMTAHTITVAYEINKDMLTSWFRTMTMLAR